MKIEELIEKYINGETSIEEEKDLKKYILNAKVLPQQNYLKHLFKFYQKEKDDNFLSIEETMQLEAIQKATKGRIFTFKSQPNKIVKYLIYSAAVIACILVGFFTINYFTSDSRTPIVINNSNLSENKEIAIYETERAFSLVAKSLHSVYNNLEKLEYFDQSLEKLKVLELINNYKQK